MPKKIVGVMGPGSKPTSQDLENAYTIGQYCAKNNITILTGGSNAGVMEAALKGAKEADGDTIGVLPFSDKTHASEYADHVIVTSMGSGRNNINVLSSDIVVACGLEAGTLSEVALAIKGGKIVILMTQKEDAKSFLKNLAPRQVAIANSIGDATTIIEKILGHDAD
ncbi:MAG: LOG family protein [Alphaproteobacteria bacterium]|nr:LOG family protein [Alphaproteobacteria bacterium]